MTLSFPDTDLPLGFAAAFGADPAGSPGTWDFEDLTSRLTRTAIVDAVNRRISSSVCDASNTSLTLDNDDGELTALRAMSSYWPNVKRDVPCKLTLRRADDTFTRTTSNGWGTSDSGHVWTTQGGSAADYSTTGMQGSVAVGATTSDRLTLVDISGPHQDVRITVSTNATPAGGSIDTGVVARYADSSNYYIATAQVSTGGVITARIAKREAGVLSEIDTVATTLSAAASVKLRFRAHNDRLQLKLWQASGTEPDTWDLDLFDGSLTSGDSCGSYSRRNTGNTTPGTFTYDDFDTTHIIRAGHADVWNPVIVPTTKGVAGELVRTRLTFSGPIRRLTKGQKVLRSPLFRSLTNVRGEFIPHAYAPMEDRSGATQFASGLIGGSPMTFTGDVQPAADGGLTGSEPLPVFGADGRSVLPIPAYVDTDYWLAVALVYIPESLSGSTNLTLLSVPTNGSTIGTFTLFMNPSAGEFGVTRYAPNGSVLASTSTGWDASAGNPIGNRTFIQLTCRKDEFGTDDHIQANLLNLQNHSFGNFGENIGATGYGQATGVGLNGALCPAPAGGEGIVYGHTWLMTDEQFDVDGDTRDYVLPALAYIGELASDRVRRLCLEEGVPVSIAPGETVAMAEQQIDTFFNNVALCATSDQGVLGEDDFGLSFIPRIARYNRPVSMTIDMGTYRNPLGESEQQLAPVYDDAEFFNEWTVTNVNGSSAPYRNDSVTTLKHDAQEDVSLFYEADLIQDAAWRTRQSNFDTHRYPDTPISLTSNPELIGLWLGVTSGLTRIVRTALPARGPDGDIDEVVASFSQRILPRSWEPTYTGQPAIPWDVGVYGTNAAGTQYDSANSFLDGAYDADDASLTVVTDAGHPRWRTNAENAAIFPFDIKVLGIRLTVTAISGTGQTQTFTVTRSVDGYDKPLTDGAQVRLWNPGRYGL